MPPRLPLQAATRQCRSFVSQWTSSISTTSRVSSLKSTAAATSSVASRLSSLGDEPSPNSIVRQIYQSGSNRAPVADAKTTTKDALGEIHTTDALVRQMPRRWKLGDVYAPHDLSVAEMRKHKKPTPPTVDIIDMLGINPIDEYRNFTIMSEFMSSTGRIMNSTNSGLRPRNQRRIAKAIRRAIGIGIMPSVHRHPEILLRKLGRTAHLGPGVDQR